MEWMETSKKKERTSRIHTAESRPDFAPTKSKKKIYKIPITQANIKTAHRQNRNRMLNQKNTWRWHTTDVSRPPPPHAHNNGAYIYMVESKRTSNCIVHRRWAIYCVCVLCVCFVRLQKGTSQYTQRQQRNRNLSKWKNPLCDGHCQYSQSVMWVNDVFICVWEKGRLSL